MIYALTRSKIVYSDKLKTLDGLDHRIMEQSPYSPSWWSFKFNGPGLRYEVALEVESGHVVWAFGGLPCGRFPDLKIARVKFVKLLRPGEKVVLADRGYKDGRYFMHAKGGRHRKGMQNMLARHENVNRRIKSFDCLSGTFRQDVSKHSMCFHAVCNLIQIAIASGEKLPDVAK